MKTRSEFRNESRNAPWDQEQSAVHIGAGASWTAATESSELPLWPGLGLAKGSAVLTTANVKAVTPQTPSPHSKTWRQIRGLTRRASHIHPRAISGLQIGLARTLVFVALIWLAMPRALSAADDIKAALQQGLLEEEGNHNLAAAIQAYQAAITQFDKDRQLAASAIFRLGECYRKLANTNEAVAQYERIVREFADQSAVLKLSQQNLSALAALPSAPLSNASRREQKRLLEEEIRLVEKDLTDKKKQFAAGVVSQAEVNAVEREVLKLRRQLAALDAGQAESPTTETAATGEEQKEVQRIKALIQDSPDLINSPDQTGRTPLHKASAAGQLTVARFLLANKADVNARLTKDGSATPLILAAGNGHKTMVELLLANGADVNATGEFRGERSRKTGTALHFSAANNYKSVAEVLLANKADVNAKGSNRSTPLHEAAVAGSKPMVELLLANGAEINALDSEGTPLYHAASQGHEAVVELLIARKADVYAASAALSPPVAEAVHQGRLKITEMLLANGADVNAKWSSSPLLHVALKSPEMLKLILAHKPDLEIQDGQGLTPLQRAVFEGASFESVQLLLAAGAKPNTPMGRQILAVPGLQPGSTYPTAVEGCSSLIVAVLKDRVDLVAALLEHGADPNAKFRDRSALHYAIVERRSLPLVNALLASRPNTELRDNEGCTPLLKAILINQPKICEVLIKAGANVNATVSAGAQNNGSWPALNVAVKEQFKDIVGLLLANKAEVNVTDKNGYTPLFWAKMRDPNAQAGWQTAQEELTQLLLKHGANEYLQRLNYIGVARGGQQPWPQLFSKGTNAYNRYSLFEAIAMCYPPPPPP
ncbi:MAG TPA: ankyrin repeat domain-containing protein, partial [Candidatus Eisenbacteria bacterium]|nr:ankyrin repeat domain-containing protein [Candidatus Eisenbacteria bacterium]